ncbi:MAG: hypothetical protein M5R40_28260 [Anaerolineae bacterium]|nr:hypothetical protein [Anaerolineae bacterium]
MMEPSAIEVEKTVNLARQKAIDAGVAPENLDAVASALATLEILGARNTEKQHHTASTAESLPETFAEWADHYTLKTHFERFLAATVYLLERKQVQAVTTSDITRMYEKARWPKPKNLADVFAKAAQKVLFTEAEDLPDVSSDEGLKMWRLTQRGYNYFQTLRQEVSE